MARFVGKPIDILCCDFYPLVFIGTNDT